MMDFLRQYLLRLICAALLCAIAGALIGKKGVLGAAIKLVTGIFMVICMVTPLLRISVGNPADFLENITAGADDWVQQGQKDAAQTLEEIIKSKTEAYILDKAKSYGAELSVEVRVDGSELPVPCAVSIRGSISPYGKKQLEKLIVQDLGIALEDQTWTW